MSVATAMQHICLAKALMLIWECEVYHSSIPPEQRGSLKVCPLLGSEERGLCSQCQAQITENLNYLFGLAFSADDEPSLRIMACHALCACSSWIDDPLAQNLLFDLLRRTERENGWPWAYVEQRILAAWHGSTR